MRFINKKVLGLILNLEILDTAMDIKPNKVKVLFKMPNENNTFIRNINLDTLCRLYKEWIIKDTNDILNTFNSTSINGWVAESSIHNKQYTAKTELEAVMKLAEFIAKEKGII